MRRFFALVTLLTICLSSLAHAEPPRETIPDSLAPAATTAPAPVAPMPGVTPAPATPAATSPAPITPIGTKAESCTNPYKYPPSLIKSFNEGCTEKPSYAKFCNCMIRELEKTVTLYDFIEMSNAAKPLEEDTRFVNATGECMVEFPTEELSSTLPQAGSNAVTPDSFNAGAPDTGPDASQPTPTFNTPAKSTDSNINKDPLDTPWKLPGDSNF